MKRPSFQFYPADWQANSNLRRCTRSEKSVWLDVLCLMHDQEEYGVIRWTLKEIAEAAHCKVSELKALIDKGVLKGAEKGKTCAAYVYVPRSGRRDGAPVTLIPEQEGTLWYSSRFVRDEYVRKVRGESTRYTGSEGDSKDDKSGSPDDSPKGGLGDKSGDASKGVKGDGSTSSSSSSSSPTVNDKTIVEQGLDSGGGQEQFDLTGGVGAEPPKTETEIIEGVFDYWRKCMSSPKSKLDDKRKGVIRRALKAGYSPFDLCRAIRGCSLTPHNQGYNERGQKYVGIHVCLKDADQIDRFIANSRLPPKAPEKKSSGQIPGWWNDDALAKQQAALVGVSGPHPTDTRETFHARIRAAIDNGGVPVAPVAAPAPAAPTVQEERVQLTDEQKAANRAALQAALKGVGVKVTGNGITME